MDVLLIYYLYTWYEFLINLPHAVIPIMVSYWSLPVPAQQTCAIL